MIYFDHSFHLWCQMSYRCRYYRYTDVAIHIVVSKKYKVMYTESNIKPYKFGDGQLIEVIQSAKIPIYLWKQKLMLEKGVDVNIPLLLSRPSMKETNMQLSIHNDSVLVFGEEIPRM